MVKQIQDMLDNGINPVIEFTNEIAEYESYDARMRAEIISIVPENEYFIVNTDFTKFEEYNKQFAQANWYDKHGNPTLKWHETNIYPEDKRVVIYDGDDGKFQTFVLISTEEQQHFSALMNMYKTKGIKESFHSWLIKNAFQNLINEIIQ